MYDYKVLEYQKVIDILLEYNKLSDSREYILDFKNEMGLEEVKRNLDETRVAYNSIVKMGAIPLHPIHEIKNTLKRSKLNGVLSIEELLNVVELITMTKSVKQYFQGLVTLKEDISIFDEYVSNLEILDNLKTSITLAISEDGKVLDNASRELFMARRSIQSLENRLKSKLNELLMSKASMLTEALIVQRDGRMCLPVKVEYKNTFKGIVHDLSSSQTTAYIEPESTVETQNQLDSYIAEEKKQVLIVLKNLSLLVMGQADSLLSNLEKLIHLDIAFAKAKMGIDNNYEFANVKDAKAFNLKRAKHPLLNKETAVPIDCYTEEKSKIIIITGPNTGGKTVALKTIGLLHLMAYNGLMVPAHESSVFAYYDSIYADIGDEQSIEQSLSTFSSHMTRIVSILKNLTENTLVLFDELGSGTDPKEGSSLAIAIIEYIKKMRATCICTTHYSELKTYAYKDGNILNASVEFNTETLKPTYRLLMGIPGKSNAILIASRLGLLDEVIEEAKCQMKSSTNETLELMGNLEDRMHGLKNEEDKLNSEILEYKSKIDKLNLEKIELQKKTDKIIQDAKNEAKKIIEEAKEESLNLIQEIKNMSNQDFKDHELTALKTKVNKLEVKEVEEEVLDDFSIGDYVFVKSYEKYGTISDIKKNKYYVNLGQFSMEFKKNELRRAAKPEAKPKKVERFSGYNPASRATLSLDLRGKRVEDVNYLLDQYLDQAMLGNLEMVSIIHGFGTGAVRKAVWEYLKNCPYAKKYRYGGEGEGLNGVTIVYLK